MPPIFEAVGAFILSEKMWDDLSLVTLWAPEIQYVRMLLKAGLKNNNQLFLFDRPQIDALPTFLETCSQLYNFEFGYGKEAVNRDNYCLYANEFRERLQSGNRPVEQLLFYILLVTWIWINDTKIGKF